MVQEEKSVFEMDSDEYFRKKIKFLNNRIKELKAEIKRTEHALEAYKNGQLLTNMAVSPRQLNISPLSVATLDYSVPYWKPKVYDFLFENPAEYTTEQILLGVDLEKVYQKQKDVKARAIKSISSSLFQLHKAGRVNKIENPGRRGYKWAVKEPVPNQKTGTG